MNEDSFEKFIAGYRQRFSDENGYPDYKREDMQAAWQAATAKEREECAVLAEDYGYNLPHNDKPNGIWHGEKIAEAIRRKEFK
jgi:hypothetical protein